MPIEAVVNTSPLIFLDKIGLLKLLGSLYQKLWITEAVFEEIRVGDQGAELEKKLKSFPWVETTRLPAPPLELLEWDLGRGETSVIAFARQHSGVEALIDDRAANRCARLYGISCRGTIGILLLAKERGEIREVKGSLEALIKAGCWISKPFQRRILELAGEKE
jgi:predicted nucleic acid-binding protein